MENTGFKFRIMTTKQNQDFTLPLVSNRLIKTLTSLKYNFIVYWGDGTSSHIDRYNHIDRKHVYEKAGKYEISICGTCDGWHFNGSKSALLVTHILDWGGEDFEGFAFIEHGFAGCRNLISVPKDGSIKVCSPILTIEGLFTNCCKLRYVDGKIFYNLEYAQNFNRVFFNCIFIPKPPVDLFSRNKKARYFKETFSGCADVKVVPTKLFWENEEAIDFSYTFSGSGLTAIPKNIFKFNPNAKYFDGTFSLCYDVNEIPKGLFKYNVLAESFSYCFFKDINIDKFDKDIFIYNKNIKDLSYCFAQCNTVFQQNIMLELNKITFVNSVNFQN